MACNLTLRGRERAIRVTVYVYHDISWSSLRPCIKIREHFPYIVVNQQSSCKQIDLYKVYRSEEYSDVLICHRYLYYGAIWLRSSSLCLSGHAGWAVQCIYIHVYIYIYMLESSKSESLKRCITAESERNAGCTMNIQSLLFSTQNVLYIM